MSLSLRDLLEPSAICLNYTTRDSADVVAHLGDLLQAAGYVKETFVEAALAREAEMPTGLPLAGEVNAAIPHTDSGDSAEDALAALKALVESNSGEAA